ncbi:MAG: aldehyde dehydrogenase family protein, partial [Caldilineaceae bacterium]|nr:aldehyde dehydrogenase family protein [Caldilineaceae bacterium]
MKSLLERLRLHAVNPGASTGQDGWITDPADKRLVSYNPTTGEPIAAVVMASAGTYDKVVAAAQDAFTTWRTMPAPKRGLVVRDLGNALREHIEPLGEMVALEMGKIRVEGIGEVQEMVDICDFAVGLSRQLYGLTMHSERPGHRMYEQWHPLGPIGIISAFNFPVAVWAWNSALAWVCGNACVWKPSEKAPLTAIACTRIAAMVFERNGYDPALASLLIGDGPGIGELMTHDERIPLISATGSTRMGKRVGAVVAARLGHTILELGGNNAIIISPSADLDMA